jgi:hypothetical protein
MLQSSIERMSAATGSLSTNRFVLYFTFAAKYSAQDTVYAVPSLVHVKTNVVTTLAIQASIFN